MNNQEQSNLIERVSIASDGTQANGYSGSSSLSDDGRYVVFESNATNLVSGDINANTDTFIYDRLNKAVELISVASNGTKANGASGSGSISGNGRYVTYSSSASNLVAGDTNGQSDIFFYDRQNKTTELISVASNSTKANGASSFSVINDNGNYLAFESMASNLVAGDTNGLKDIFLRDRQAGTTKRINVGTNGAQANGTSVLNSISDDGRYISYTSQASNLVSADTNGLSDIFIYDRQTGTTERINIGTNGIQANGSSSASALSGDGRYVVYESEASNLVAGDTNDKKDIFIYDRQTKITERVDVANDGTQSSVDSYSASISDDGRYVAFLSDSLNNNRQFNAFLRDRVEQTTVKIEADSFSVLSGDGRSILFNSSMSDLVANDTNNAGDVFVLNNDTTVEPPNSNRFATEEVHRFYQFEIGSHLYTTDTNEIDYVRQKGEAGELSYSYEGEKFAVLADNRDALTGEVIQGVKPVYRFFNTQTGAHLYTMDENEKSYIEANLPNYSSEGIKYHAFESDPAQIDTIPVYRLLNSDSGSHLYTIDQNELNYIQANLPNFTLENNGEAAFHVFEL